MNEVKEQSMERLLEEEDRIAASLTKTAQRVKIEMGHTWNLRFLPVEMGPDKAYYVRLAQHWRNNRPVTCPKLTPMYMGGSLDASCPVCDVHEKYNEGGTEEARDIAYKAKCVLRYRMWCVVFDKENSRGVIDEMTDDEILIPWEFDMYKTTWEDFRKYQKWATTSRKGAASMGKKGILDLETGCNMLATHGNKGTRLDRMEPGPILEIKSAEEFDAALAKIWSKIRKPTVRVSSEKELLQMADKFEEDVEAASSGGSRRRRRSEGEPAAGRSRGRGADDEDSGRRSSRSSGEDDDVDRPSRRGHASDEDDAPRSRRSERNDDDAEPSPRRRASEDVEAPTRRSAARVTDEDLDTDQVPGAEHPARTRHEEPAQAPKRRSAPVEEEDEPVKAPKRRAAPVEEDADTEPAQAPKRRSAPVEEEDEPVKAPKRRSVEEDEDIDPVQAPKRRTTTAEEQEPAQTPVRRAAAATGQGVDDEVDNAPEEKVDPAPATKGTAAVDDDQGEEPPPRVSANSPAPTRSAGLKSRLERLTGKGQ